MKARRDLSRLLYSLSAMSQTLKQQITKINEFESMKESESSEKAPEKPGEAIAEPAADLKSAAAAIAVELRAAAEMKAESLKRLPSDPDRT